MSKKLLDGIGSAISVVPELYQDALQPAAQETGKVLALIPRAIRAALSSCEKWILSAEYNLDETEILLAQKLENVPPEKIVEPESYIAVPAIQSLSYAMDSSELRNLYANLLAKSMYSDAKDSVHPAYIETIKQLSPKDAAYFKHIYGLELKPVVNIKHIQSNNSYYAVAKNFNTFSDGFPYELIISNLIRLGLLHIPHGLYYSGDGIYDGLIETIKRSSAYESWQNDRFTKSIEFEKSYLEITDYGKSFYKICVSQ
jgi:hypothetical protein